MRYLHWVQDDDPGSEINRAPERTQNGRTGALNRRIAYNRMRGQHGCAMEHAAPESLLGG
ncbi:MAG: hypothetical protein LBI59_01310 [Candidatus Accumulibacter sp.]|jgi:hypothetical protein|nr:hypothetical protein [Accumulibacter sp.]